MSELNEPPKPTFAQRLAHDNVLLASCVAPVVASLVFISNRAGLQLNYRGADNPQDWRSGLALLISTLVVCAPVFVGRMRAWGRMVACQAIVGDRSLHGSRQTITLHYEMGGASRSGTVTTRVGSPLAAKRKNARLLAWVDPKAPERPRVVLDRLVRPPA